MQADTRACVSVRAIQQEVALVAQPQVGRMIAQVRGQAGPERLQLLLDVRAIGLQLRRGQS